MPKVAIIDDDPDIVEACSIILESKGFDVVSAASVSDGLETIDSEGPDLILLDVMMDEPDDGFYLANKLRKIGFKKPIILLTSVSKTMGYEFGPGDSLPVQDFLEKPVSPDVLVEKVNYYLEEAGGEK